MLVRVIAIIAAIAAVIFFFVALIVNATTNPTSVAHYQDLGFIFTAISLGLYYLSTIVEARVP